MTKPRAPTASTSSNTLAQTYELMGRAISSSLVQESMLLGILREPKNEVT